MIWLIIGLVLSVGLNLALTYGAFNIIQKNEIYEESIRKFYIGSKLILDTARRLDEKQMFEKDDEVGMLFEQLIFVIRELEELIDAEEEKEEEL